MNREINIKLTNPDNNTVVPPATSQSAAFDVKAAIDKPLTIYPNSDPVMIPLGFAMEGEDTDIRPCVFLMFIRSSLGVKHGLALANSVGVIDTDYRGEVCAGIINNSISAYTIQPSERIAQIVCLPIETPIIKYVTELSDTQRGTGGFGSTGK